MGTDRMQSTASSAASRPGGSIIRFSTDDYAPHERLTAWREVYGRTMCKVDIDPVGDEGFHTDVTLRRLPGLNVMSGHRSPASYRRGRTQLESDNVFVTLALTGGFEATQLGRTARMAQGDALVGTGSEPMDFVMPSSARSVTLSVPLRTVAPTVARIDAMYGRRIPREVPALQLLIRYVDLLEEPAALASPELQQRTVSHVHDLLALALGATREFAEVAALDGARAARLREIKTGIEASLGREDLSVVTVAARHRLPVRYVQRLFESDGTTFTEFLLERRLAHAHRCLVDPRSAGKPIGIIAFESGFTNQPYFNRTFRARYGGAPSEVRAQSRL